MWDMGKKKFRQPAPYQPSLSFPLGKQYKVTCFLPFFRHHSFVWVWIKGYLSQLGLQAMWQVLQRGSVRPWKYSQPYMPTGVLPTNGKKWAIETIRLYYHLSETSPPGPQRAQTPEACFYSTPLGVSAEWYSPHYLQKKQLIWICSYSFVTMWSVSARLCLYHHMGFTVGCLNICWCQRRITSWFEKWFF